MQVWSSVPASLAVVLGGGRRNHEPFKSGVCRPGVNESPGRSGVVVAGPLWCLPLSMLSVLPECLLSSRPSEVTRLGGWHGCAQSLSPAVRRREPGWEQRLGGVRWLFQFCTPGHLPGDRLCSLEPSDLLCSTHSPARSRGYGTRTSGVAQSPVWRVQQTPHAGVQAGEQGKRWPCARSEHRSGLESPHSWEGACVRMCGGTRRTTQCSRSPGSTGRSFRRPWCWDTFQGSLSAQSEDLNPGRPCVPSPGLSSQLSIRNVR